jgi:hypothetical protein
LTQAETATGGHRFRCALSAARRCVTSPVHEGLISAAIAEECARGTFDDNLLAPAFFCHVENLYTSETPHPKPGLLRRHAGISP